jgi:hypothetical protein
MGSENKSEKKKVPYFNREISWLAFNRRVLEQATSEKYPILERVKFLSFVSSNLDEFFEILTWRQLGIHNKPIFLLNSEGYFDGLVKFTENAIQHDFIQKSSLELFNVCSDLDSCIDSLERFFAED